MSQSEAVGNVVVLGHNIVTLSAPNNMVRWLNRDGKQVLQQAWSVTSQQGATLHQYAEWRDVPTEDEIKSPVEAS